MAVVFLLVFTLPYSLAEHGDNPKQTIASIGERSFGTAALYLGGYAVLFGLYGLGYWLVCRRAALSSWPRWQKWLLILGFGLVFNLVLMPMYPADSTDIYGYIIRGRMSSVHGLNPMVDIPSQIPDDPFYEFASWRSVTSPYGPAWEALTALTSSIAGDGYLSNVIAFKTVAVLGFLITAIAVGLSLEKWAPGRVAVGLLLYAWNPLVICKTGGAGHNDAVMTAWLLVSIALLLRERYLLATLAAVVGALVKFIPLMVVPVIAVLAIRKLQGRRRWGYLLQAAIFGLLIVVLFHLPFGKGLDLSYFMGGGRMYTATPVTVGRQLLIPLLDGVDWGNRIHATPV
ncbi:MAG: polyprenol phosphomannose-dependent alpha 1,6 mannosyltransferase MptB, partial [Anaerolineales bacterium]